MSDVTFTLVKIRDLNDFHDVGGQDLPSRVTVKVSGDSVENVLATDPFKVLDAFNVKPSAWFGKMDYIEFMTFAFDNEIQRFCGIEPPKSEWQVAKEKFGRSANVQTIGELRAAIADLPDDFPLICTQDIQQSNRTTEHQNVQGLHVSTGEWSFLGPGCPGSHDARWSMRIEQRRP